MPNSKFELARKTIETRKIIRSSELQELLGSRTAVQRLVKSGGVHALGNGYYTGPQSDSFTGVVHVAGHYYPDAVISGAAALFIYRLTDNTPDSVQVDIDNRKSLKNRLFSVKRVDPKKLIGIRKLRYNGRFIRIYDEERSLCEAYLLHKGTARFMRILERYLTLGKPKASKIRRYDIVLNTKVHEVFEKVTQTALQSTLPANGPLKSEPLLDTKTHLVSVARALFASHGPEGLTPSRVADEAGVDIATVTYHLGGKQGIKDAVINECKRRIFENITEFPEPTGSAREFVENLVKVYLEQVEFDEENYRIQIWSLAERNSIVKEMVSKLCTALVFSVRDLIKKTLPQISDEEAESRSTFLFALLDQYATVRWVYVDMIGTNMSKRRYLDNFKRQYLDMIVDKCFAEPTFSASK